LIYQTENDMTRTQATKRTAVTYVKHAKTTPIPGPKVNIAIEANTVNGVMLAVGDRMDGGAKTLSAGKDMYTNFIRACILDNAKWVTEVHDYHDYEVNIEDLRDNFQYMIAELTAACIPLTEYLTSHG
jgi:hypothetical protein